MEHFEPILKELMSGDFEKNALKEINQMLNEEIAKPASDRDYDKIEELTKAYSALSGMEDTIQEAAERNIPKLTEMTKKPRIRMTKRLRILTASACAALVLLAANAITVAAWDMNVFSTIIHITQGGFSVEFPEREAIVLPTSEDDPYGIKTECTKYGLEVETPIYLPEGFVLGDIDNYENPNYAKYIDFHFYRNKKEAIVIDYSLYNDGKGHTSIPSDNFNLSETIVNGKPAIISKEDNQYTIIWYDGNLETEIYTYNLDYDECDKIVASIK